MKERFEDEKKNETVSGNCTTEKVRNLNDRFRQSLTGGRIMMTQGVSALSEQTKFRVIEAIRAFDSFDKANDPYGEHDFGEVKVDGQRVWFKIDYYDKNLEYGSPDPANSTVTSRVMTILLPEEY